MHQIRAHLAAIGHAIAGDPLYGAGHISLEAPRLWLHAESVDLPDEIASELGAPARITCPLWEDLELHLRALGVDWARSGE
jgi:23S rRNA-/tRNA-specific pseudouridylate synthase